MVTTILQNWMSWEGGVDLVGLTKPGLAMPNVIVHVARLVHTPDGSAPAGMILWQPDPAAGPALVGFIAQNAPVVGNYFGPKIFAGTPFENAPVLPAKIEVDTTRAPGEVSATVSIGSFVFKTNLKGLSKTELIHRPPAAMSPFWQQGLEAAASSASLTVNGQEVAVIVPPTGISGGPAAVWSPWGGYAR
jgi:hypothetical protein